MIELLKKIEYALRKDSLTDNERVASARALVCAAISKAEYSGVAQTPLDITNHHNALKCPYCNPEGLAFAAPVAQGAPWQPIETAPKNNTRILLWYPWTGRALTFAPPGFHYIGIWTCTDEGVHAWRDPDDFEIIGEGATHWMPLQDGPALTSTPGQAIEKTDGGAS